MYDDEQMPEDESALQALSDQELMRKLEEADIIEAFEKDPRWKLFREATRRVYERADQALDMVAPDNQAAIMMYQLTKRFYKNVIVTILDSFKNDGEAAFYEAKDRGIIDKVIRYTRTKFDKPSR